MRRFLPRTIVLFLICGLFYGCGSSQNDFDLLGGQPSDTTPTSRDRYGMVYLTRFAGSMQVEVLPLDTETPLLRLTTDSSGGFKISKGTSLPREFRVRVETPEGVRVERYSTNPGDDYLFVNAVSSLISIYKLKYGVGASEAETAVRNGLDIGDRGLYGTSDGPQSAFSHRLLLDAASAEGGLEIFLEDLAERIHQGEIVRFQSEPNVLGRNDGILSQVVVATFALKKVGGFLLSTVGEQVVDEASFRFYGKLNAAFGLNLGNAASFEFIDDQLLAIESQISRFENLVSADFAQAQSFQLQSQIDTAVLNIGAAMTSLKNASTTGQDFYANPSSPSGPASVPSAVTSVLQALSFLTADQSVELFTQAFTETPSSNKNLFFSTNFSNSETLLGFRPDQGRATSLLNYDLRRDDITEQLNAHFGQNFGYLTQLATLVSELGTSTYLPQGLDQSGAIPSVSVVEALESVRRLYGAAQVAQQIVPQACGSDMVLIDAKNQKMWYFPVKQGKYNDAQNGMLGLTVNNWGYYDENDPLYRPVGSGVTSDLRNFVRNSESMRGWRLPNENELKILAQQVQEVGGGTDDSAALAGLQQLGFQGLTEDQDRNYKKYWFNGSVTSFEDDFARFSYVDLSDGETKSEESRLRDTRFDPVYSYVYVRTLQVSDSLSAGDTADQQFKAYGGFANLIEIVPHEATSSGADIRKFSATARYNESNFSAKSDFTDWVQWSLEDASPSGVAFLSYEETDQGQALTNVVFRGPGEVTLRAKALYGGAVGATSTIKLQSSRKPKLRDFIITPTNLLYLTFPTAGQTQSFHCTGYLDTGEPVDLTNKVKWSFDGELAVPGAQTPSISSAGVAGAVQGGVMTFGDRKTLGQTVTIRFDTYTPDPSERFEADRTFSGFALFKFNTPP